MKCNWYKPLVASVNHFSRNTQLAPITSVIHILNFLLTHILDCLKGGRLLRLPISEKNWKVFQKRTGRSVAMFLSLIMGKLTKSGSRALSHCCIISVYNWSLIWYVSPQYNFHYMLDGHQLAFTKAVGMSFIKIIFILLFFFSVDHKVFPTKNKQKQQQNFF